MFICGCPEHSAAIAVLNNESPLMDSNLLFSVSRAILSVPYSYLPKVHLEAIKGHY